MFSFFLNYLDLVLPCANNVEVIVFDIANLFNLSNESLNKK